MRKLLTILLFVCLLSVPAMALADNGDQLTGSDLLYNGDFSVYTESAPLPSGWELNAYQNNADSVSASVMQDDDGEDHKAVVKDGAAGEGDDAADRDDDDQR